MRISKRVLPLFLAGCCGLGLWLTPGAPLSSSGAQAGTEEVSGNGATSLCPIYFYAYVNGMYYYAVGTVDAYGNCMPTGYVGTTAPHHVGCPSCPDPITTSSRTIPFPKSGEEIDLKPKPDPKFSGVLR